VCVCVCVSACVCVCCVPVAVIGCTPHCDEVLLGEHVLIALLHELVRPVVL
jgi:hypothetical protein